jgi:plasmid stability protein
MTLIIENLPDDVSRALQERAAAEKKSLDATAVDALARGLGIEPAKPNRKRDLSFLAAGPPLEPEVLAALKEQRQIDPELWQ